MRVSVPLDNELPEGSASLVQQDYPSHLKHLTLCSKIIASPLYFCHVLWWCILSFLKFLHYILTDWSKSLAHPRFWSPPLEPNFPCRLKFFPFPPLLAKISQKLTWTPVVLISTKIRSISKRRSIISTNYTQGEKIGLMEDWMCCHSTSNLLWYKYSVLTIL